MAATARSAPLDPDIERAILSGQKIIAIKIYRERTGASLTDALRTVNEAEQQLRVAGRLPANTWEQAGPRIRTAAIAFIVVGLCAVVYLTLTQHAMR
jgi:hypothetical protein